MHSPITTYLVLAAILLQGVFGSLQGSVVICLGGGHQHAQAEIVEKCGLGCSHDSEWPTPATDEDHIDNCECTDIELGLIVLLSTTRATTHDLKVVTVLPAVIVTDWTVRACFSLRGPSPNLKDDPGKKHRLAVIRSTRLIV